MAASVRRAARWLAHVLVVQQAAGFVAPVIQTQEHAAQHIHAPARQRRCLQTAAAHVLDGRPIAAPIEPVSDTVVLKLAEKEMTTTGGLFLPELANKKRTTGTVVAVGPGKKHWETGTLFPMASKPGQQIVFGRFDGAEIKYDQQDHLLLRDDDCLLIFSGDKPTLESAQVVSDRILVRVQKTLEQVKVSELFGDGVCMCTHLVANNGADVHGY